MAASSNSMTTSSNILNTICVLGTYMGFSEQLQAPAAGWKYGVAAAVCLFETVRGADQLQHHPKYQEATSWERISNPLERNRRETANWSNVVGTYRNGAKHGNSGSKENKSDHQVNVSSGDHTVVGDWASN